MCGITGKLNFDPTRPVSAELIGCMNHLLAHRGPDDSGQWTCGPAGLGQRRLAIVDLSPRGHQPMCNEDETIWITFNGEIYNHRSLRAELEKKGHQYRSQTDTETIIHLYEEFGRDCVHHLRGMFAFAIWDQNKRRLLLARDRFGQKPLVYAQTQEGITFASEIKALLQDESIEIALNEAMLDEYLRTGYIPSPHTMLRGIHKLPPAHTLVWQEGDTDQQDSANQSSANQSSANQSSDPLSRVSIQRYWQLDYTPKRSLGIEEAAEQTLAHLREATKVRLMSDVPLGAFLSGGIDSSAVVALMAEEMSEPVKTFSIGFNEGSFNETDYARQVAQRYETDHTEFVVGSDALTVLPQMVWAYGEPFADSSALPTYYLAQMTREHVTVALNGDGGDELFAGYERYVANQLSHTYDQIPKWIRQGLLQPLSEQLPEPNGRKNPIRRLKNFIQAQNLPEGERYLRWLTLMDQPIRSGLYTDEFAAGINMGGPAPQPAGGHHNGSSHHPIRTIDEALASDIESYLPDDLLVKVDIATMCHSLEARSPFLDHHLAEFAATLPESLKLQRRQGKFVLKKALQNHLSENILYRRKAGFSVPIGRWFREDLKSTVDELLLDHRTESRGIFKRESVEGMLKEHHAGTVNHRYRIWALMMLELWFRTYIDRPRTELTSMPGNLF